MFSMSMFSIQEGFVEFESRFTEEISKKVSDAQLRQIYFFAGAGWMLQLLFAMNEETVDAASGLLDGLRQEANTFFDVENEDADLSSVHPGGNA